MTWTKALPLKVPVKVHWAANRDWRVLALVAALSFLTGKLGLLLSSPDLAAPPIWPTAGLALAAVLIFGYRIWPGILVGAFLSSLSALAGAKHNPPLAAAASVCIASGETMQALVAAWLVETHANGREACRAPHTLAIFVAVAALAGATISATSTSLASFLSGLSPAGGLSDLWVDLWLANVVGVILIAPLLLLWSRVDWPQLTLRRGGELIFLLFLLVIASAVAFGGWRTGSFRSLAVSCVIVPILLWSAFRFGERGTSAIVFLLGCFALAGSLRGNGPFVMPDHQASMLLLQNFIAALTFMSLLLATEVSQRQRIGAGLRASEQRYRESDQRLRLALAASRMGIWTMELQGQTRFISSPELDAIFGLKPGEFDGTQQMLFAMIHPEDHALVQRTLAEAIQAEGDYEIEFRILPRDRPEGWLLARGRSCFDANGKPTHLLGVAFDISARKTAEQEILNLNQDLEHRVAERTAQLETINKELESFSYSVSHDLRAPLRSIRGFSEVLLDRYAAKLDDRGREFLKRACESSHQMDLLIEDLLKLSRIGRAELHEHSVDLSSLAESIVAELRATGPPLRSVKFHITPGLQACGDERLLRIMLENLLRNAWKFTAHQPKARIEFGRLAQPEPVFFVRDNGAGFDMANAARLFGVFQRLHSTAEFPGTGIGLATVQRILNRHGGRAWAQGAVDQGATFYFTLPAKEGSKPAAADCAIPLDGVAVQDEPKARGVAP